MTKFLTIALTLGMAFVVPARSDDMIKCDKASAQKVITALGDVIDPQDSEALLIGKSELAAAVKSKQSGNLSDCAKHLQLAMEALKGQ
jgi:hypothetical protein